MINIIRPGMLTTIQDTGRWGYQKYGVPIGGAMDPFALSIANILVGNEPNAAALEVTVTGPVIELTRDTLVAVTGSLFCSVTAANSPNIIPQWKAVLVKKGTVLDIGKCCKGCRGYIAFSGGIHVPHVLNSSSTYLRASFGGYEGRALKTGDKIALNEPSPFSKILMDRLRRVDPNVTIIESNFTVSCSIVDDSNSTDQLRVVPGNHEMMFHEDDLHLFYSSTFKVSPNSDRMGYRLDGPHLHWKASEDIISEPTICGTIQIPQSGQPIVLMADGQPTGGYPKIANIITRDIWRLAHFKPGDMVKFTPILLETAQSLYRYKIQELNQLQIGVRSQIIREES